MLTLLSLISCTRKLRVQKKSVTASHIQKKEENLHFLSTYWVSVIFRYIF